MNTLTDLLYGTVYLEVFGNDGSPYGKLKQRLYRIDSDYFEKIPAWTEEVPKELNLDLTAKILGDFKDLVGLLLNDTFEAKLVDQLRSSVRTAYSDASSEAIAEACQAARQKIHVSTTLLFNYEPCPHVSEEQLDESRRKAERITLGERLRQDNNADVIAYHHALMHKTIWDCKRLIDDSTLLFAEKILEKTT